MPSLDQQKSRMKKVLSQLRKDYPDAKCSLTYENPFQLAVATILSAQCTDARVNQVTPVLFSRFQSVEALANADIKEIERIIRSTGFYKNKAESIKTMATTVLKRYQGKLPEEMSKLIELRGIGRKTANVILGTGFKKNIGVVVDTHVGRISRRMGFTGQQDPVKVEQDLMKVIPKRSWTQYSHLLIDHGRAVCTARKAKCDDCKIVSHCPKNGI